MLALFWLLAMNCPAYDHGNVRVYQYETVTARAQTVVTVYLDMQQCVPIPDHTSDGVWEGMR